MAAGADDIYLWEQVTAEGDAIAFEKLYRRYVAVLFSAVSKHVENKDDVSEIVQETFMDLWENREKIAIRNSFFTYLYSIARYKTYKYLKNSMSLAKHQEHWLAFLEAKKDTSIEQGPTTAAFIKIEQDLEKGIASLPDQMQLLFRLKFEDRLSNSQIAERMNLSRDTIKKYLTLLRKQIKKMVVQILFL